MSIKRQKEEIEERDRCRDDATFSSLTILTSAFSIRVSGFKERKSLVEIDKIRLRVESISIGY